MKLVAVVFLWTLGLLGHARAGEVSFAFPEVNPNRIIGLKFEGEIVPGDGEKIRNAMLAYAPSVSRIFLYSKGGDVVEAMKIGRLIRRLRFATETGNYDPVAGKSFCLVKPEHSDTCICASACFLAFAGGAYRYGNYLLLHRPFLTNEAAANLSDVRQEEAQKSVMLSVRKYLEEMEVPSYYAEAMMARSSQDAYLVTADDDRSHRLLGNPASIEEITLRKCKVISIEEFNLIGRLARKGNHRTPEESGLYQDLSAKLESGGRCQSDVMKQLQADALKREFAGEAR